LGDDIELIYFSKNYLVKIKYQDVRSQVLLPFKTMPMAVILNTEETTSCTDIPNPNQ
jgi:hypothetical protein